MEVRRTIQVKLDAGAIMPTKAHENDAGWDLYAREDAEIGSYGSHVFDTGVHIEIPPGYVGMIKSKSGLNINHGIQSEGVVDAGFTGSIKVKLYNHSLWPSVYSVKAGDKISQIVIEPIATFWLMPVNELEETERGSNGFGSSGR